MSASRRDFEAIALAILQAPAQVEVSNEQAVTNTREFIAYEVARHFNGTVPTFDSRRFLKACGVAK